MGTAAAKDVSAPSYPHMQQLTTDRCGMVVWPAYLGAGTGIIPLVLVGLGLASSASASAPTSYAESCILSTDLREFSIFNSCCEP